MNSSIDPIFHWRSSGPNLFLGALLTICLLLPVCYSVLKNPKGKWAMMIIFGLLGLYVPTVFIRAKLRPDEIWIDAAGAHGTHAFSGFSIRKDDISSIVASRDQKTGHSLFIDTRSSKQSVAIPVIWGDEKERYKAALRGLCPDHARLDW